jgi:hypothetical protein
LGQEDEFFEDGLSLIKSVGSIPVERPPEVRLQDWFSQEAIFHKLGFQQAPEISHWIRVLFFSTGHSLKGSELFKRLSLPKDVMVACGNETFPWKLISNTVSLIIASGW